MACPDPLLPADGNNTNFIEGTSCAFRCEGTMVNQDDLDGYNTLIIAVSGTSWVLAIFLVLTWGCFSVKSRQKMTFWVVFTSVGVTSCVFLPAVINNGANNVWCKDELEPVEQSDGFTACLVQAMAIMFFGLALCVWWWCSCFDLFSKLYLRKRDIAHYLKYYHIFSWGVPTFNLLVTLITGNFGYEQPRLWCFLSGGAPEAFEYIFFYAWVGALWISGTIMMLLVVWSIFSHGRGSKGGIWKKVALYRTPLVFVVLFSFFWAVFFTFILVVNADEQEYIDDATEWITCLFTEFGLSGFTDTAIGAEVCGDKQPNGIGSGLLTTAILTMTGNGILLFLIFGLQTENFLLWYKYLSSGCSAASVRPKNVGGAIPHSQFKQLRLGLAQGVIGCCEGFAGIERQKVALDAKEGYKLSSADIAPEAASYQGFSGPPQPPVSPMASSPFPHHSYQMQQAAAGENDPFPRRPPVLSESTIPLATSPPGLEQFYGQARQNTHNSGGWSDIYDDPLWGVNVEF